MFDLLGRELAPHGSILGPAMRRNAERSPLRRAESLGSGSPLRGVRNDGGSEGRSAPGRAVVAATMLLAFALVGCSGKPAQQQASTTPHNVTLTKAQQSSIHVVTVEPAQYHTTITTTGVVDFDHDRATDILAPFSGAVTNVLVTLGQHVEKGQALAP